MFKFLSLFKKNQEEQIDNNDYDLNEISVSGIDIVEDGISAPAAIPREKREKEPPLQKMRAQEQAQVEQSINQITEKLSDISNDHKPSSPEKTNLEQLVDTPEPALHDPQIDEAESQEQQKLVEDAPLFQRLKELVQMGKTFAKNNLPPAENIATIAASALLEYISNRYGISEIGFAQGVIAGAATGEQMKPVTKTVDSILNHPAVRERGITQWEESLFKLGNTKVNTGAIASILAGSEDSDISARVKDDLKQFYENQGMAPILVEASVAQDMDLAKAMNQQLESSRGRQIANVAKRIGDRAVGVALGAITAQGENNVIGSIVQSNIGLSGDAANTAAVGASLAADSIKDHGKHLILKIRSKDR